MSVSLARSLSFTSFRLSKHLLPDSLTFPNLSNVVSSLLPIFLHLFISSTVSLCLYLIHFCLSLSFTLAFGTREPCGSEVTGEQPPKSDSWPVTMTTARCCVKGQDNKWGTGYVTSHTDFGKRCKICHANTWDDQIYTCKDSIVCFFFYVMWVCLFMQWMYWCVCDVCKSHPSLSFNDLCELTLWPTHLYKQACMS